MSTFTKSQHTKDVTNKNIRVNPMHPNTPNTVTWDSVNRNSVVSAMQSNISICPGNLFFSYA